MNATSRIFLLLSLLNITIIFIPKSAYVQDFSVTNVILTSESPESGCVAPSPKIGDFSIYDERVYIWIDWENYQAGTVYRYEWYNPAVELIYSYQNSRDNNSDGCTWASLSSQKLFSNGPGLWTVKFFYDNILYYEGSFTFQDPGNFDYLIHVPDSFEIGNGILLAVHGRSYNPIEYFHFFRSISDEQGVALAVPYFNETEYSSYNRIYSTNFRIDTTVQNIINSSASQTGADPTNIYLYGHSAGGQFVHRYMLFHPQNINKIVISAPGWWTFPRQDWEYPYGTGYTDVIPDGIDFKMAEVTGIDKYVIIGELDVERDDMLYQTEQADLQGLNRLQRSAHWVNCMTKHSFDSSLSTNLSYSIIPDATHNNVRKLSKQLINDMLFDSSFKINVEGYVIINSDAANMSSSSVEVTIFGKTQNGCGEIALSESPVDDNYSNYQSVTWTGNSGDIQYTKVPYTFVDTDFGLKFLFCRIKGRTGGISDNFGDAICYLDPSSIKESYHSDNPSPTSEVQIFPNPFNSSTKISVKIPHTTNICLKIYNIRGQEVYKIIEGRINAGKTEFIWDGVDHTGRVLASGIYFAHLKGIKFSSFKRILLLK